MSVVSGAPANAEPTRSALTVLTPLRAFGNTAVKAAFWLGDRVPQLLVPLRQLSLIHFARWSVLPAQSGLSDVDLLLFESDFDGDWDEYIDSFAQIVGRQISAIWASSYGFPGPTPTPPFRSFIHRYQLQPSATYQAYSASVTQINAALRLAKDFAAFRADAEALDAETFKRRWDDFLTEVQFEL
jgi:hypothetical protein